MPEFSSSSHSVSIERWMIIIPARLHSTRLERKPLQDLGGKPLIIQVVQNLSTLARRGFKIVVATDSEEIVRVCREHQVFVEMTSAHHESGTDRCYEVLKKHPQVEWVLNVQGDEPFADVNDLWALVQSISQLSQPAIATLYFESNNKKDFSNPNVVKTIRRQDGEALYFSRAPIPFDRNNGSQNQKEDDETFSFLRHLGVYAYHRDALAQFCRLTPSLLETREKLEQLRAMDHGIPIYLQKAQTLSLGIDTPEDLECARKKISQSHGS